MGRTWDDPRPAHPFTVPRPGLRDLAARAVAVLLRQQLDQRDAEQVGDSGEVGDAPGGQAAQAAAERSWVDAYCRRGVGLPHPRTP